MDMSAEPPESFGQFAGVPQPAELADTRYYWEDMTPGLRYVTATRTVTEADVIAFAAYSGDWNRAHVDAEYAKGSLWGQRIAHGMLVGALMGGLNSRTVINQLLEPSLLGLLEVTFKYPKPTLIGDTIAVTVEVVEQRETSNSTRGIVVYKRTAVNQRAETVAVCDAVMMVARRGVNR